MINLNILDESAQLEAVILGTAISFGGVPAVDQITDPKSLENIKAGTYPVEADLVTELEAVRHVLHRYDVNVYQPTVLPNYNQIFARDIGMVIEDRIVIPTIAHNRRKEVEGIEYLLSQIDQKKVLRPDVRQRMEGGDVMPWKGKIFVGYSEKDDFDKYFVARTNKAGVDYLIQQFPDWQVHPFELTKSDSDPRANCLHLDCCFQPIGKDKAIIYPEGFKHQKDVDLLIGLFGEENLIRINQEEMYNMNSNILSISPEVILSEKRFTRLNLLLKQNGFTVEEVPFAEVSKMEGLLRCATLPLRRRYV